MLRGASLRVTGPRVAVLAAVYGHPHADTDSITGAVRQGLGVVVSLQAVYDVLRALTDAGLVRRIQPMGSVAYQLARVAAGLADITFTLTPTHEWDVAAGAALIASGGGFVQALNGPLTCNRENPLLDGLIACGPLLKDKLLEFLAPYSQLVSGQ